ncbi:MAG: atpG 1 [Rickettsiaceae bacterium]|jgi:F-type H+-transporting ATPase subunit gamma|nr:atpG 1 [Rickettsiaceae bacterium]
MANLKTLKTRIKSVKSTQKMTKAMKMVAASKLRRAKQLVEASRPYAQKIDELIGSLAANVNFRDNIDENFSLLTGRSEPKTHLLVVISSDRGLCGGLNTSAVKFAKNRINNLREEGKEVKIICIGKKGYDQLKSAFGDKIIDHISGIFKNNINHTIAEEIADKIITLFNEKAFDVCEVIYSKFKSAISQEASIKQIIPIKIDQKDLEQNLSIYNSPISFEPSKEAILEALLPRNIIMQIYNELLENSASEQGARMAAMESATNNAGKMIKNLTLVYNRTRQANITKELIDIVSGANAV